MTLAEQALDSGDAITVLDRAVRLSNALRIEQVNDR
jgi:hypothetical protein